MKRALVIGCAENVWDEVKAARELCDFDGIYCVKMSGIMWDVGPFIWVTLHPEFMDGYRKERREKYHLPDNYELVGPPANEVGMHGGHYLDRRITYRWPGMTSSGSSGLYGAKVALDDGHDRVVLAGIPMEKDRGHFTRGKPWDGVGAFIPGWKAALPYIKDKVRSMSGWTQEILGAPTPEWLNGETP